MFPFKKKTNYFLYRPHFQLLFFVYSLFFVKYTEQNQEVTVGEMMPIQRTMRWDKEINYVINICSKHSFVFPLFNAIFYNNALYFVRY